MSSDETNQKEIAKKDGSNIQPPQQVWSPEIDLANRYQSMVSTQFNSLSNFEDKAWRTIRATVSLIGIYLAGLSLLSKIGGTNLTITLADMLPIITGTVALLGTIYYSVLVLLGVKVGFGPSTDLSDTVNKDSVDDEGYTGILVEGYSNTVTENWRVLKKKSENLRKSLSLLIFGLVEASLGFIFVIFTLSGIGGQLNLSSTANLKFAAWIIISIVIGVLVAVKMWRDDPDSANPDETDGGEEEDDETDEE